MADTAPARKRARSCASPQGPHVPQQTERQPDTSSFLRSWAWKREHRPDRDRFQRPYLHKLRLPAGAAGPAAPGGEEATLHIEQARFGGAEGFASTVWDSSIVVAKLLELRPGLVAGRSVVDLSAGCGLVGAVAGRLGAARVVATDLAPNLPLLRRNMQRNDARVEVAELRWGEDAAHLGGPFDAVFACDVMYVEEAVPALVATLAQLCGGGRGNAAADSSATGGASRQARSAAGGGGSGAGSSSGGRGAAPPAAAPPAGTVVYVAHGRNRFAEAAFWRAAARAGFVWEAVGGCELDPVYQCADVDVVRMRLGGLGGPAAAAGPAAAGEGVEQAAAAEGVEGAAQGAAAREQGVAVARRAQRQRGKGTRGTRKACA